MDLTHILAMKRQELAEAVLREGIGAGEGTVEIVPMFDDSTGAVERLRALFVDMPCEPTRTNTENAQVLVVDLCIALVAAAQGAPVLIYKHVGGRYDGRYFFATLTTFGDGNTVVNRFLIG